MAKHANFVTLLAWNYGAHANNVILNAWGEPEKNRTGKEYLFNVGEKRKRRRSHIDRLFSARCVFMMHDFMLQYSFGDSSFRYFPNKVVV